MIAQVASKEQEEEGLIWKKGPPLTNSLVHPTRGSQRQSPAGFPSTESDPLPFALLQAAPKLLSECLLARHSSWRASEPVTQ